MKNFIILFLFISLTIAISCGRNEPEIETNYTETSNITAINTNSHNEITVTPTETDSLQNTDADVGTDSGLVAAFEKQIPNSRIANQSPKYFPTHQNQVQAATSTPTTKTAEEIINSPLRNLLRNAQMGKSYSKSELIEQYKFPKEAVDLIKQVTCVGPNKLYFNWGSTWFVEKVSDAEFKNDTMIFAFKKNKTYVSGGAIGIKYNKKVYTELILNKGSAYIPSVKGYHWEINK